MLKQFIDFISPVIFNNLQMLTERDEWGDSDEDDDDEDGNLDDKDEDGEGKRFQDFGVLQI